MPEHEQSPIRRVARKATVAAAGTATIVVGVALLPLPGPGSLVIFGGLTLLGSEYPAAHRLKSRAARGALGVFKRSAGR